MLKKKINLLTNTKSDINEHLLTLALYAGKCKKVTEFGVRSGCSSWALLYGKPQSLVSYDITDKFFTEKNILIDAAKQAEVNYDFIIGDTLSINIEQTDLLFIDTLHTYNQLLAELKKHHKNVNDYIILHDTTTFGSNDEVIYDHASSLVKNKKASRHGLKNAVIDFLKADGKNWYIHKEFTNNNGLLILRKKQPVKKVLVTIVNYGDTQLQYLNSVIDELKRIDTLKYQVDIFVHSNISIKRKDVTTIIHKSITDDDWNNLPWKCRKTIYDKRNDYDIFLFTENDHLFTEHHFDSFIKASSILPENLIAGFLQYEEFPEHNLGKFYPAYHGLYDWDYNSLQSIENYKLAFFTNQHQGGFLLTKKHLIKVIDLMGSDFQVDKDRNVNYYKKGYDATKYDIKVRCCTDVYTHGGMTKVIPISHFDDFTIHHLPNKYYNWKGLKAFHDTTMQPAIDKLLSPINDFTVIIPTMWCKTDYLQEMIKIYDKSKFIKEIIIIDNRPEHALNLNSDKIKVLSKGYNIFVNPAWNWGVSEAKSDNVIIANDDILINEDDFNSLMVLVNTKLKDKTLIGVDASCYIDPTSSISFESCNNDLIKNRGNGFGTILFIKKTSYIPVNEKLKIWFGDDVQFFNNEVFKIKGLFIKTNMSETVDYPDLNLRKVAQIDCVNYPKLYTDHGIPKRIVSFNLATFPARKAKLEVLIGKLLTIDTIDIIRVYLNEYTEVPGFLFNDKIEYVIGKEDIKDSGKFHWADTLKNEIYFSGDDDILFDKDYIVNHIDCLKKYQYKVFVSSHGRLIGTNSTSFDNPIKSVHFSGNLDTDININMPGTGVMCFDNSKFQIPHTFFKYHGMTDLFITKFCQENKIPCICRKHYKNELFSLNLSVNSLFERRSEFIKFHKEIFDSIKPLKLFEVIMNAETISFKKQQFIIKKIAHNS